MAFKRKDTVSVFFIVARIGYARKTADMEAEMRAVVAVTIIALAGCAPTNPLPPAALTPDLISSVEDAVRQQLKDPYSAQFEGMRAGIDKDGSTMVCGRVNAKNSFGGYVGRKVFAARVSAGGVATVESLSSDGAFAIGWCHAHALMPS